MWIIDRRLANRTHGHHFLTYNHSTVTQQSLHIIKIHTHSYASIIINKFSANLTASNFLSCSSITLQCITNLNCWKRMSHKNLISNYAFIFLVLFFQPFFQQRAWNGVKKIFCYHTFSFHKLFLLKFHNVFQIYLIFLLTLHKVFNLNFPLSHSSSTLNAVT